MTNWTEHRPGEFCIEASDLKADHQPTFHDGTRMNLCHPAWVPHFSRGEITYWTRTVNGKTYTIFND